MPPRGDITTSRELHHPDAVLADAERLAIVDEATDVTRAAIGANN